MLRLAEMAIADAWRNMRIKHEKRTDETKDEADRGILEFSIELQKFLLRIEAFLKSLNIDN